MKKFLLALIFLVFVFQLVNGLTCSLKSSCSSNETCLLSFAYSSNSHVAACGYYANKLCCDRFFAAAIRSSCFANESEILSLFATQNSHVGSKGYYANKLCASFYSTPANCSIKTSCDASETCVLELAKANNAHAAACGTGYPYKLCCRALPDLYVNESSIKLNATEIYANDTVLINITVYNIGDAAAASVNVSCYANGNYIDSDVINSVPPDPSMQEPRYASCVWKASCPLNQTLEVRVDPLDEIAEYNESNNNASINVSIYDRFSITIDNPKDNENYYRGQTINLNSTVTAVCGTLAGYSVEWRNSTSIISTKEDDTYTIGLADSFLGPEPINASVFYNGKLHDYDLVTINILNNLPSVSNISYNVTPPEIHVGEAIQISCDVTDVEDDASLLNVSINVKDAVGSWQNQSASRIGNTFYIDYQTSETSPIGYYTAVCKAIDTDNGTAESVSQFLVYKNVSVSIVLNNTEPWWNESVLARVHAERIDGSPVQGGDVNITVNQTLVCSNKTATDSNGNYSCIFNAPAQLGLYYVYAYVADPLTSKVFYNYTLMNVTAKIGAEERAANIACYEEPVIIQNPDGTLRKATLKVCVYE